MGWILLTCIGVVVTSVRLTAQAPLVTDDTAVAAVRTLHVEVFGQFAHLPAAVRPATAQRTLVLTFGYGLASRLEVGLDFPLIAIVRPPQTSVGTGDMNLIAKYILRAPIEPMASRFAVAGAIELPTGNERRGFGSGVADYNVNLIGERRVHPATTVRLNAGVHSPAIRPRASTVFRIAGWCSVPVVRQPGPSCGALPSPGSSQATKAARRVLRIASCGRKEPSPMRSTARRRSPSVCSAAGSRVPRGRFRSGSRSIGPRRTMPRRRLTAAGLE